MDAKPVKSTKVRLVSDNVNKLKPFKFVQAANGGRMFCGLRFPDSTEAMKFLDRANSQSEGVEYILEAK